MTEALNRGWGQRDARTDLLLQQERAGIDLKVPKDAIDRIVADDP